MEYENNLFFNEEYSDEKVDISEENILRESPELLNILLKDRTTGKKIIWATDSYSFNGDGWAEKDPILPKQITGKFALMIRPRVAKAREEQKARTKLRAEVFTPTWIVEMQNKAVEDGFLDLPLKEYVSKKWLEITCGEAPYMVSRYDTVSGVANPIYERVGFLDRKLQRINHEVDELDEWMEYVKLAYKSSFGYEFHGDSLLLARENLLYTFIDYYKEKFKTQPTMEMKKEIAKIISYNVFQVDALKDYTIPFTEEKYFEKQEIEQLSFDLFDEPEENEEQLELELIKPGIPVRIKDWTLLSEPLFEFRNLSQDIGGRKMKFDVVIGNPPYQLEVEGRGDQPSAYHLFMDESFKISEKTLLITPARFLFNAGNTPRVWNNKMLEDIHFKVLFFEQDSSKIFQNTDIKGGVAITYRDSTKDFGAIEVFIHHKTLKGVLEKVTKEITESLSDIFVTNTAYEYSKLLYKENPYLRERVSGGSVRYMASSVFDKFGEILYDDKPDESYVSVIGRQDSKRVTKWIKRNYIEVPHNFEKWKVFVAASNGSGDLGEVLSTPFVGNPELGSTETFISLGGFALENEAENLLKYLKTKFARALLGTLKITQSNKSKEVWKNIPLQNFTQSSDIDWSKSIPEIDQQLYKKYNLNEEEINFIETKVKEMN
ncbi:MAG: Eco57I restriction-modification methylase domain-containing protein [Streptococcaceae bacterium]|nr:Eco57I restriction-modification methylase domain-containing protein [Streptococcaceae bacterium]